MSLEAVALGAGQEVGRSCILVTLGGKRVLFDCGTHMGFVDNRCFPNFSYLAPNGQFQQAVDCVIITHFHLDHVGALPHFTEVLGYSGPIYMTHPTRAICPSLLHDYRNVMVNRKAVEGFYSAADIEACMKKVSTMALHETLHLDDELSITPYYAGHVLGAVIVHAECHGQSVVYTGDFNATPGRHLAAACVQPLRPDLLITESTYANSSREFDLKNEREFLAQVHAAIDGGGKVLIPVSAFGPAQELQLLLDIYWAEHSLDVPIYFSSPLVHKANLFYRLFAAWTNQESEARLNGRFSFDFRHIKFYPGHHVLEAEGAAVLFSTPATMLGGVSLQAFRAWAGSSRNLVLLPTVCQPGTVAQQLIQGRKQIILNDGSVVASECKVGTISFSAHADAKGLMWMVKTMKPRAVMLVHGERAKMLKFKSAITRQCAIPCFDHENGKPVRVEAEQSIRVLLSRDLCEQVLDHSPRGPLASVVAFRKHRGETTAGESHDGGGSGSRASEGGDNFYGGLFGGLHGCSAAAVAAAATAAALDGNERSSDDADDDAAGQKRRATDLVSSESGRPPKRRRSADADFAVPAEKPKLTTRCRVSGVLVLMPETRGGTSPASSGHTLSTCAPSGRSADDAQPQLAATADTAANDASAAFSAATLLSSVHARRAPRVQLLTPPEAAAAAGLETHSLSELLSRQEKIRAVPGFDRALSDLPCVLSIAATQLPWNHDSSTADGAKTSLRHLQHLLQGEMTDTEFQWDDAIAAICVHSVKLTASVSRKVFELEWTYEDEALAERIVSCIQNAKSVAKRSV